MQWQGPYKDGRACSDNILLQFHPVLIAINALRGIVTSQTKAWISKNIFNKITIHIVHIYVV